MGNKKSETGRITIKRVMVPQWNGLAPAARALKVSATQVKRHVSGKEFSGELERKMKRLGIIVEHRV